MRHFTIQEANEALQAVRPLAEELVQTYRRFRRIEERAAPLRAAIVGNGTVVMRERLAELERAAAAADARARSLVERIQELGAQVKDLEAGLIDFPAERGGETVLLCWHVGENEIGYWHGLEEGFAGRKPLPL